MPGKNHIYRLGGMTSALLKGQSLEIVREAFGHPIKNHHTKLFYKVNVQSFKTTKLVKLK